MTVMRNHNLLVELFVILLAFCPKIAATDYAIGLNVDGRAIYDDNFRLTEKDKIVIHGMEATPQLLLNADTEDTRWNLDTKLRSARYNENEYDTDDQFLSGEYSQQFERSSIGLGINISHDSTNTSEFARSGRISNKSERHEHYELSPSWNYGLTENNVIGLNGTYSRDNYENTNYIGYDFWQAGATWSYMYTERLSFLSRTSQTRYRSEDLRGEVPYFFIPVFHPLFLAGFAEQSTATKQTTTSLLVGVKYLWSEQQFLSLLIGHSKRKTEYPLEDPKEICDQYYSILCLREDQSGYGLTTDVQWGWKNERHKLDLNLSQSTQPTSNGQAVDQLQLSGSWSYALSELQSTRIAMQGYRDRDIDDKARSSNLDRDYLSVALEYNYRLTEVWQITSSYQYRLQKHTELGVNADAQVATLGIRYQPTEWHWSR